MFSPLCIITSVILYFYGLGLIFIPDFFLGKYIYKSGLWDTVKRVLDENSNNHSSNSITINQLRGVLSHLIVGAGLGLISWASAYVYACFDTTNQRVFSIINIALWSLWVCLDNVVRWYWKTYNIFSSVTNAIFTCGMLIAWSVALGVSYL